LKVGVTERYVIYLERGVRRPSKTLQILLSIFEEQENEKAKGEDNGKDKGHLSKR